MASFEELVIAAIQNGGIDVSIEELIRSCGLSEDDLLGSAAEVISRVGKFKLELHPGVHVGTIEERRILKPEARGRDPDIRTLLDKGDESSTLELKSSMVFDVKRFENTGEAHRNSGVTHSVLKTICGFANASGGELLVGVSDDKTFVGLSGDYGCGIRNRDDWQLELSNLLKGRFSDGARVELYVDVTMLVIDDMDVAHVRVLARRDLTFLKSEDGKRWEYYYRSGNKTEQIHIEAFEEHLMNKRGFAII